MRRIAWGALILLTASMAATEEPAITRGTAVKSDTSPPIRDLMHQAAPILTSINTEVPIGIRPQTRRPDTAPGAPDSSVQLEAGPSLTPSVDLSFEGLTEGDNTAVVGFEIVPPDTNGDIGLDHEGNKIYIQYVNLVWQIFDATDGSDYTAPMAGNTFWTGFGGGCENENDGDPLVLYDDLAGQWVLAQFVTNNGLMCFAISQTSDPLGPYHRYAFQIGAVGGTADYPKMGIWAQGAESAAPQGALNQSAYTLMTRNFPFSPSAFSHSVVLERDEMLAGGSAEFVSFGHQCVGGDCVEGQLPPHQDGPPPPFGTCPTFVTIVDKQFDDSPHATDGVRLHRVCVDWANTANSTISETFAASAVNFDRNLGGGFSACITPVPNPGEALDCLNIFSMYRAQYRYFDGSDGNGTHASVVLNTTVEADANRAGIHWMELRSDDGESSWSVHQQGTYAPSDGRERWMGSIAQDGDRNMALGFSRVSGTEMPALYYASRDFGDTAGTLGTEEVCHDGTGVQTGSSGRWGDYSSMSVDPEDDCTFWFTSEYYETTGSFDFRTRICSFRICNLAPSVAITMPADDSVFDDIALITFEGTGSDDEDGDLSASLDWTSSLDGSIGSGASFAIDTLSPGPHVIEATVTDSGGESAKDQISLSITTAGCPVQLDVGPLTVSDSQLRTAVDEIDVLAGVTVETTGDLHLIASETITFVNGLIVNGNGVLRVENSDTPCT